MPKSQQWMRIARKNRPSDGDLLRRNLGKGRSADVLGLEVERFRNATRRLLADASPAFAKQVYEWGLLYGSVEQKRGLERDIRQFNFLGKVGLTGVVGSALNEFC